MKQKDEESPGRKKMDEIFGSGAKDLLSTFEEIHPDLPSHVKNWVFGDFYQRKALDDKTREILVVASLVNQGKTGLPFRAHIKAMKNLGVSEEEILEILLFLIPFVGFPKTVEALLEAKEVLKDS